MKPPTASEVPPAPDEALEASAGWGGRRCICGLPAWPSAITKGALVHSAAGDPAALAYLSAHPHNVELAS